MRTKLMFLVVVGCVFLLTGTGAATTVTYWDDPNPDIYFNSSTATHSYTFDISSGGWTLPPNSATLWLYFHDDGDSYQEWAKYKYDGVDWQSIEVDGSSGSPDVRHYSVSVNQLSDGRIQYSVGYAGSGDFYFEKAGLEVCGTQTPIPGAVWLLGSGLLGLLGLRKRFVG